MKRIRAAVPTAAVTAGTVPAASPAQTLSHCEEGVGTVIREYGLATCAPAHGSRTVLTETPY
ncbi:hypothetical protein ACIO87_30285 [Streptomyces sp. NPDC087218]|uniref:hypothetical protein n=1 Tax=unclassified Streptomyces TaxID=2593676 RepID=UPI0036AB5965